MDVVVVIYLWLSLLLYLVLGGADFGAGIIEMFTSPKNKKRIRTTLYQAIGPIWEANHMWLIIAVVILFVGFPDIYSEMSVYLHIPLAIMLLGIIARGTAFIFRHYDAVQDKTHSIYNKVFVSSSFITPLFLGIIAGSAVSGKIDHNATNFADAYIFGWLNLFSFSTGLFTVSLCGYLAAVYLIEEADNDSDRTRFVKKARFMSVTSFISGGLVFIAAIIDDVPLMEWVFTSWLGLAAVLLATVSLWFMWTAIDNRNVWLPRILVSFQATMILLALSAAHFPDFILVKNAPDLSLLTHQAPEETMNMLGTALIVGSFFILPALFYLYYSFKGTAESTEGH